MQPDLQFSDEQLAEFVQKGHKEKFGILMDRYEKKIFRYGRKFLFDQNNVEDIVQEVFLKTYQNIQSFDLKQKFSSWIYRIAHNTFINALKKKIRNPLYFFDFDTLIPHGIYEESPYPELEHEEIRRNLNRGLKQLKPHYREIIILFYVEELGYREIAEVLHIPPGTVGIRLKRAKAQLQKFIPHPQNHEQ